VESRPAAVEMAEAPRQQEQEEDLPVLPGESISKYRGIEPEPELEAGTGGHAEVAQREPEFSTGPFPEPELRAEAKPIAEPEPLPEPAPVPVKEPFSEPIAWEPEVIAIREPEPESEPEPFPALAEEPVSFAAVSASESAIESDEEYEEEPAAAVAGESGEDVEAVDGESSVIEGVEPARIPTSLTAQLREQGGRYPHRVSRRTRRKTRGSGDGRPEGRSDGRPEAAREPRTEPQAGALEQRSAPRQERGERPERERPPQPSISDLLREGQEIIVQISKEPLGQKGARITSYVALPGRFVVYMPTVDHVGVSRKIASDEERLRLKRILQQHRAGIPGGFILRTAGEGRSEEELRTDMHFLYNLWMDMRQKAEKRKAPALIHHDLDLVQRILRDQLTSSFKNVWVDNEEMYEEVLSFVQRFQPAMVTRVKLYTRPAPIFDAFNITSELEKALKPKVWLKTGGYIVINQTEALVAIDINTGKYVGKSNRLEDTIVKTNTDAVKEIVRQIRLRDLGGIIVVDFIDMDERRNRQKVMQALEEAMAADRAPNKILAFNDFGLVAITRKRVKQSLERTLCAPCPYCEGAGYIKSVSTVIGEILTEAGKIARAVEGPDVVLRVNPDVAKVLKSHNNDHLAELEEILGRTVIVKSDPTLHQEKFDLA
jgi:ribonuclease G